MKRMVALLGIVLSALAGSAATWTADNGNGTFTNPLFYDEFSDPDLIRVGEDYYLTGTTMHTMPGLPVLHSKDLVNWELLNYVFERLDLGPEFRLEGGKEIYGQGIWAPCLRYDRGTFHIFTNVNGQSTQHFQAKSAAGPWTRTAMKKSFHDLSVLFDDDGKAYVIWGYGDIQIAQLNDDLTDIVAGTQHALFKKSDGMGEGLHFYKIKGRYLITSAWFVDRMRMICVRSATREGPYEINAAISTDEDFGLAEGNRLRGEMKPPFQVVPPNLASRGRMSLHQGGIVDTPTGEWWGFSMMDFNSVGRLTCLSPVTWEKDWPYFGLPGNLGRTPRTWIKPATSHVMPPSAPYVHSDDFSGPKLQMIWQWNHVPDDAKWSLAERPGFLRLHPLAATDFWRARNTLTQRAVGPQSVSTALLYSGGLKPGDVAGLALLNLPYAWIGLRREADRLVIEQYNQLTGQLEQQAFAGERIWLRAECDFLREIATFSYSEDGEKFRRLGKEFKLIFQLKTFQGVRFSLFAFNDAGTPGGSADFDRFTSEEPHPHGLMRPIPFDRSITLTLHERGMPLTVKDASYAVTATVFAVVDRGLGRVALRAGDNRFLTVQSNRVLLATGVPAVADTFQWMENVYGDVMLLSLSTNRFLRVNPVSGVVTADHPGPQADRRDGSCFDWQAGRP